MATILVTGATDGIGLETARQLARRGHHLILHGRRVERLEAAREAVVREADGTPVETVRGDLGELASVRALGEEVAARWSRLDVLVNNAGVFRNERETTADGFEATFAVNHLAPFLLTHLLLERLAASGAGRVVNVSSIAHTRGKIAFDDLMGEADFNGYRAYAQSKLANVLFTLELARRLGPEPAVTVNALHPGVVSTKLLIDGFGMQGNDTVEEGAETSVFLATAPELAAVTGRYFTRRGEGRVGTGARDPEVARRFYDVSVALTGAPALA
ncbi:MAG: SDR family oxidoreductase [Deltaproteobacteria bacterium]|nr:MAG: SDR family oxidoreductase [Deltaproteobacteria bacterium]